MDELKDLKILASKALIDKAIFTLKGILEGIILDKEIEKSEINELQLWLNAHKELVLKKPFNEFALIIENLIKEEIPTIEAIEDLIWLSQKFENESIYYNAITSDLHVLQGLLHGILSDGIIDDLEIIELNNWLSKNEHLATFYPYDELRSLIVSILSDKIIEDEERLILKSFINQFVDIKDETIKNQIEMDTKDVNINGICAIDPDISFENKSFCITGLLSKDSRNNLKNKIIELGGLATDTVTLKTDYLIVGSENNPFWTFSCYGRKVEKALNLRKKGHQIILVHEYDIFDAIEDLIE